MERTKPTDSLLQVLRRHLLWRRRPESKWAEQADLCGKYLPGYDLRGTDLSLANLRGVNLTCTDLTGANLFGAKLEEANLYWAKLDRADLRGANLSGACLSGASITGAWLADTSLVDADLARADLRGVNLSRANLLRADLSDADLRGARLEETLLTHTDFRRTRLDYGDIHIKRDRQRMMQMPLPPWPRMPAFLTIAGGILFCGCVRIPVKTPEPELMALATHHGQVDYWPVYRAALRYVKAQLRINQDDETEDCYLYDGFGHPSALLIGADEPPRIVLAILEPVVRGGDYDYQYWQPEPSGEDREPLG